MKIGMMFPGYASQYVGMGKDFYDEFRIMQEYFEQASHCLDINFVKLCFASSDSELSKMIHAYSSLFLVSSSIAAIIKDMGIAPDLLAGYGVGQYAALHSANGLAFADGLYLLNKYSSFAQLFFEQQEYQVVRIRGMSVKDVEVIIHDLALPSLHIAAYETSVQCVISGNQKSVDECLAQIQEKKKVKVEKIAIDYGLHSPVMHSVIEQFEVYFEKVDFKDIQIPLVANSSAKKITKSVALRKELIDYEQNPLLWEQVMKQLSGCSHILLIGPGTWLQEMFVQLYPEVIVIHIQKPSDLEMVQQLLPTNSDSNNKNIES